MRSLLIPVVAGILVFGTVVAGRGAEENLKSGPQPGTRAKPTYIPASFQVWMVTGPRAARYHSLVCEYAANPVVFMFVKEFDPEDKALVTLLKKLDTLGAKHADARFGCCLIVLNDAGYREVLEKGDDDLAKRLAETASQKEELEKKLNEMAATEKLSHLALALDTKAGPQGYQLNEEAQLTVILYNKHVVLDCWAFKDKLKAEDVERIYGPVEKTVLEVERLSRPVYRNRIIKKN